MFRPFRWLSLVILLVMISDPPSHAQGPSPERSPQQITERLLTHYGRRLDGNSYIHALAVIGRLQAAEKFKRADWEAEVQQIAAPYLSAAKTADAKSHSQLAGHLIFAELARSAPPDDRSRCVALLRHAAGTLLKPGGTVQVKPPRSDEMSDAVFMCAPLLCAVGSLQDDDRYIDATLDYLTAMRSLCLRDDGLYRHSTLCDAAWGRGNGFPAIGVARCLQLIPAEHPRCDELITVLRDHLSALAKFQDDDGSWHQVIDIPSSYSEMSCTCMIGWAMETGISSGWLTDPQFRDAADRAWDYVTRHIGPRGEIDGVCEGTGKQVSVAAYLNRKAIRTRDDRGGAMALLFAVSR